jgi:hypothetical protein
MKPHRLDLIALLSGLVITVIGAGFLLHEATGRDVDAAWVSGIAFISLGAIALGVTLARRPQSEPEEES